MKEYPVETLIYYSKIMLDAKYVAKSSKKEVQENSDAMSKDGWCLTLTDVTNFGDVAYIHSYFEREIN